MTWLITVHLNFTQLAEEELPESQCGFCKGRRCRDMSFAVSHLVEKAWEHWTKAFILCNNLRKAYNSVPHRAMWFALEKLGLSSSIIQLIQSFHHDMQDAIQLGGTLLDPITSNNGLTQGYCMAKVVFKLYACLFVEHWVYKEWEKYLHGVGAIVKYKHDQKLFRRYKFLQCR